MRASFQSGLLLASMVAPLASAERVLGAYIFARHGDRTAKISGNTELTDLGYQEVFDAGSFYNARYINSSSPKHIQGISSNVVNLTQVLASAPEDTVLQNSGTGFMQGVYPPVGPTLGAEKLANGKIVQSPLGGYQLIPLSVIATGENSEDSAWLEGATGCPKATVSSNDYFLSSEYLELLSSTNDFYHSLAPMLAAAFNESSMTYLNAYTIFDYLNVAQIHNSTDNFPHQNLLTDSVYHQLLTLANAHEYGLAYNASEPVRAIAGAVLAAEILQGLNDTITGQGELLGVQFGSYGTFLSLFGLMGLPKASVNFTGIPDYASSAVFELVTNASDSGIPSTDDISVRFTFHNGTLTGSDEPMAYPLFGRDTELISWSDFMSETQKIAVNSDSEWCEVCGVTTGACATSSSTASTTADDSSAGSGGISRPVAGVIGAMVTLAVVLGLEAVFFLIGGFTIAKRRKGGVVESTGSATEDKK
ncbi:Histidine phosphatase superfamily clade-2 [Penicillium riverlandense]|uniref:Histidine phosphatase superfamily clade-2 n=1 Tax=Penicillium riverlandense TaxID=1903569 RepID=UPI00254826B3|nr:Histidine phosphatase superfamily clade-2 [Penicillium riverlandense]KAJ5831742.1 Histidine phosphatase superfamily clade-2 [Penicillium riverlandense]